MEDILNKISQHAMNYAIRAGIGITASYTLRQTSRLLKTVEDNTDYRELRSLQKRLDSRIQIISPAIDIIEIAAARGNSNLQTALTETKSLRWEIQSVGVKLAKAAAAEEESRKTSYHAKSRTLHAAEIRQIVQDMRKLLQQIEDSVKWLELAITTSGVKISNGLPPSVSMSRLIQGSAYVNESNSQYFGDPSKPSQVGPTFTLSLYMLFAGHTYRMHHEDDRVRELTWMEVIHKAKVKLMRVPFNVVYGKEENGGNEINSNESFLKSIENEPPIITGRGRQYEYAYRMEIIEDLDDDRVHSSEDGEHSPGPYGGVELAGIRDFLPIHQISKIFYADTGKILEIGNETENNNPVLLLKRDVNALPPLRMMHENENSLTWDDEPEETQPQQIMEEDEGSEAVEKDDDSQEDIDEQIRRESSVQVPLLNDSQELALPVAPNPVKSWRLPSDLDPEWLAFSIYNEEEDSDFEDDEDIQDDSAYISNRRSSPTEDQNGDSLANRLNLLKLDQSRPRSPTPNGEKTDPREPLDHSPDGMPPVRSTLSTLEMLIRLTSLQQFQQAPHLAAKEELLGFFLDDSSTTGAGNDGEARRRTRNDARRKVGFDPYDESPIKQRGEEYQYQHHGQDEGGWDTRSRVGTPYEEKGPHNSFPASRSPHWLSGGSLPAQGTPEPWLLRSREGSASRRSTPELTPSSPVSPYRPQRKATRPLDRVQQERRVVKGSPLGRGISVETDSTLGTSPGSPTLVDRRDTA